MNDKETQRIHENEQEEKIFKDNLHRLLEGNRQLASRPLVIGKTPYALSICGANAELPLTITKKVIDKCTRPEIRDENGKLIGKTGHGLTEENFLQAINAIKSPVMIFKGTHDNSRLIVTDIKDANNRNVVVAVELNQKEGFKTTNQILSSYGRDNLSLYVDNNINNGNLIAINIKKANQMLHSIEKWYLEENTFISFDNSIAYTTENVNYPNAEKTDKKEQDSMAVKKNSFNNFKQHDYDFEALEEKLLANGPNSIRRADENYREPALTLMEKYGYEETYVDGFSDDGFLFIKSVEGGEPHGFDGWQMIKEHFDEIDKLVENYTQDQLQNRLDGDLSVIEYGMVTDDQVEIALNAKIKEGRSFSEEQLVPHGEENNVYHELTKQEQMQQLLKDGVKSIMDSDSFANWCETQGRLFSSDYSFRNAMLVYIQNPGATYVCGYEQWKDFGRQVKKGAKAIKISSPVMAQDLNGKGSLYSYIRRQCKEQLKNDPNKEYASHRVGKYEFIMYKNGRLFDVKDTQTGRTIGSSWTIDQTRKFIDQCVIGKIPIRYNTQNVFDIKDTIVTDTLFVSRNKANTNELILNEDGQPITDSRGHVKIKNTAERQARFNTKMDPDVMENSPGKMAILYDVIKKVSEERNVPFRETIRNADSVLIEGADGYFRRGDNGEPGSITISSDLTPTQKVRTSLHELAHSDLHQDLSKLAEEIGVNQPEITRQMKEVQAEAVAYMTASSFGIQTDHKSFAYIAGWSDGRELKALEKSLDIIYKESQQMVKAIEYELDERGFDINLNVKDPTPLTNDVKLSFVKNNKEFLLNTRQDNDDMVHSAADMLSSADERTQGMLKEQIILMKQIDVTLTQMNKNIELYEKSESRQDQEEKSYMIKANKTTIDLLQKNLDEISKQMITAVKEDVRNEIKDLYTTDPEKAIRTLQKEVPGMENLEEKDIKYLSTSKFINEKYGKLIGTDNAKYAAMARAQLENLKQVMSKNQTAIEIEFCEQWSDKPIFTSGEVLHPAEANRILAKAENQIQELRKQAEKAEDYYPYSKCNFTIYSVTGEGKLSALNTRIDIGDGEQKDIADHLGQIVKRGKERMEVVENFKESLKEKPQIKSLMPQIEQIEQMKRREPLAGPVRTNMDQTAWEHAMNNNMVTRGDEQAEQESAKEQI